MIEFFFDLTLSIFTIFMSLISLCCYLVCSVGKYFGDIDLTISFFLYVFYVVDSTMSLFSMFRR